MSDITKLSLITYRYTKLRIFALKLKKKLNETVSQLQDAEQDKAKLEKLLQESGSKERKLSPGSNTDEVDGSKKDDQFVGEISELQAKVNNLTVEVEASERKTAEIEKLKGIMF